MMDYLDKINQMKLENPIQVDEMNVLEKSFPFPFPEAYKEFLLLHNGGEGPVGEYGYIAIFGSKELIHSNGKDPINEYHPELFYFASDQSKNQNPIVELPSDSIDQDDVEIVAENFSDFINYVYNIDDSELDE